MAPRAIICLGRVNEDEPPFLRRYYYVSREVKAFQMVRKKNAAAADGIGKTSPQRTQRVAERKPNPLPRINADKRGSEKPTTKSTQQSAKTLKTQREETVWDNDRIRAWRMAAAEGWNGEKTRQILVDIRANKW